MYIKDKEYKPVSTSILGKLLETFNLKFSICYSKTPKMQK